MSEAITIATGERESYTLVKESAVLFGNITYRRNSFIKSKQGSNTFICDKRKGEVS